MAKMKWNELGSRTRRFILAAAAFEGALKVAALVDLARRPASEVRGSKLRWAIAVTFLNSVGVAPLVYFARGRRRSEA